ncbi:MAG: UTRA domain-containing protein [Chloroflexota bacterium]
MRTPASRGQLHIAAGEQVLRFTWLRLGSRRADGGRDHVGRRRLVPGLAPQDLDGSLYELLSLPGSCRGSANVTIEPVLAEPAVRRAPGVPLVRRVPAPPHDRLRHPGSGRSWSRTASIAVTDTS